MCIPTADSWCCMAETNTTLQSNYSPIKKKLKIYITLKKKRKESACQCRGHESDVPVQVDRWIWFRFDVLPWSRKIPRAAGQLNPGATTTEAHVPRAHAPQQEEPQQ